MWKCLIKVVTEITLAFSRELVFLGLLPSVSLLAVSNSHVSWRICSLSIAEWIPISATGLIQISHMYSYCKSFEL